jgi:hypothetical protein|nr:MAG TPA: hypothetical protein [Caudoviricetes sp.]
MNTNKLSCGLFMFHDKNWWRNLKDIPIFFQRIFFTLKHGYSPVAQWETFEWFIAVMREILINYRDNRTGTPVVIPDYNIDDLISENKNIEIYNNILNEMIELLDKMDECNSTYNGVSLEEMHSAMNAAKDKFFELFSKYFYTLWD